MTVPANLDQTLVNRIVGALDGLRYGAVEVTVHDGRIVQIERKKKVRFTEPAPQRRIAR